MSKRMTTRIYPLITPTIWRSAVCLFAVCAIAVCSIGCRAGQQAGSGFGQPNFGQLGQRVGNIAVNRAINEGITRAISGF